MVTTGVWEAVGDGGRQRGVGCGQALLVLGISCLQVPSRVGEGGTHGCRMAGSHLAPRPAPGLTWPWSPCVPGTGLVGSMWSRASPCGTRIWQNRLGPGRDTHGAGRALGQGSQPALSPSRRGHGQAWPGIATLTAAQPPVPQHCRPGCGTAAATRPPASPYPWWHSHSHTYPGTATPPMGDGRMVSTRSPPHTLLCTPSKHPWGVIDPAGSSTRCPGVGCLQLLLGGRTPDPRRQGRGGEDKGTRVPWAPRGSCRCPLGDGVHRWVLGTAVPDPSVPPGFV